MALRKITHYYIGMILGPYEVAAISKEFNIIFLKEHGKYT